MKIQITVNGHQYHQTYTGTVIQWGHTVELFENAESKRVHLNVPSVILRLDDSQEIKVISLKEQYRHSEITVLEE